MLFIHFIHKVKFKLFSVQNTINYFRHQRIIVNKTLITLWKKCTKYTICAVLSRFYKCKDYTKKTEDLRRISVQFTLFI